MLVVNPNEPLGNVLEVGQMIEIVKFCYDHNLALIAYEVLQDAVHDSGKGFQSFRKTVHQMPSPYNNLELFSIHSASKTPFFE